MRKIPKQRKSRRAMDHGIKVIRPRDWSAQVDSKVQKLVGGNSGDLEAVRFAVQNYYAAIDLPHRYPRPSEQKVELTRLIRETERLSDACQRLSQKSRLAILDVAETVPLKSGPADPFYLRDTLRDLVRRSRIAIRGLAKDTGGRPRNDKLMSLLVEVSITWFRLHPDEKGVAKSFDRYYGDLVVFASALLELLGIREPAGMGLLLYEMRGRAKAQSKRKYRDGVEIVEGSEPTTTNA